MHTKLNVDWSEAILLIFLKMAQLVYLHVDRREELFGISNGLLGLLSPLQQFTEVQLVLAEYELTFEHDVKSESLLLDNDLVLDSVLHSLLSHDILWQSIEAYR